MGYWLNAGVMDAGEVSHPERGTPQGGVISPLLSNLYLHEVRDLWLEHEVKPRLRGRAFEVRFADDAALVFEHEEDARRMLAILGKRFARFGLRLHSDKTEWVDFRSPQRNRGKRSQRARSLQRLGFTHHWGRSRKGRWIVKRKTARERLTRALRESRRWLCRPRPSRARCGPACGAQRQAQGPLRLLWEHRAMGVPGNARALSRFQRGVRQLRRKWLNRRSWHSGMDWEKFARLIERYPRPPIRIVHSIYRRAATPSPEKPDAGIPHVRICRNRRWETTRGRPASGLPTVS